MVTIQKKKLNNNYNSEEYNNYITKIFFVLKKINQNNIQWCEKEERVMNQIMNMMCTDGKK